MNAQPALDATHPAISTRRAAFGWGLLALLGIMLLPRILTFFALGIERVAWPWQFDYDEGINLNAVVQLASGHNIYHHNGPEGFLSAPYPPLFYILNVSINWIAGPSFGFGRAVSLFSTLAIAVLLAYVCWKITRLWAAGALSGLLWLTLSPVIVWSTLYKQDMPALALGLGGLAWALTYPQGRRVYAAAILFALAFYTKQSALSAAAATTLWLLARDRKVGLRFVGALVALVPVPFLAANFLLKGGLLEHTVGNHVLPWSGGRLRQAVRRLSGEYWPLLVWGIAAWAGILWGLRSRVRHSEQPAIGDGWGLAALYALVGGLATLVQAGYEGANYNHLLDGLMPLCLLAGLSVGWLWKQIEPVMGEKSNSLRSKAAGGAVLLGVLMLVQLFLYSDPTSWYRGGTWPSSEREGEMNAISSLVARTPGDAYSEDAYLLLRNHKEVIYDDASTFVPLAETGGWDDSLLTQALRDRRFGLVMLMRGSARWTPRGLAAFQDSYSLKFPGSIETYEPKLIPDNPQYSIKCTLAEKSEGAVSLEGYSLAPGVASAGVKRGDVLRVALYWKAAQKLTHIYASYVHIVSENGDMLAGRDNPATGAPHPTTEWQAGKPVTDTTAIPIPSNLGAGRYRLIVGMYRPVSGDGLHSMLSSCPADQGYGDAVMLGWIEIK